MPFVDAKCPGCSSVLPVDNTRDVWICSYCGKSFIVAKAIAEYKKNISGKHIAVPDTVKSIEYLDFSGCDNIHSITINVQNIGSFDFSDCKSLESININAENIESLEVSGCQALQIINFPKTVKVESIEISDCKNLNKITKK